MTIEHLASLPLSAPSLLRPDDADSACPASFVDVLEYRVASSPTRVVFRLLGDDGVERDSLTFEMLRRRAIAVARRLTEVASPGDRVAVLVAPGLDFVVACFGCFYAGMVAVPSYAPSPHRRDTRVSLLLKDAAVRVALVSAAQHSRAVPLMGVESTIAWLDISTVIADSHDHPVSGLQLFPWSAPPAARSALAMLQYTSGSTGDPRGVMLTHDNLLHQARLIHRVTSHQAGDSAVFWLPPFHDMGLIGGILQPVYADVPTVLMTPASFLQRPARWLEAISRYRATTSGAPDFAYDLCVDRIGARERSQLDLSSWRVAFNGAEPVRAETVRRFIDAFAPSGLRRSVFVPCYGLAEATLLVSGGPAESMLRGCEVSCVALEQSPMDAAPSGVVVSRTIDGPVTVTTSLRSTTVVSCGIPAEENSVIIVHPVQCIRCVDGVIGEIWVRGRSVAAGYWNRPDETAATFGATLAVDDADADADEAANVRAGRTKYLRTGDLGFFAHGELHVTGRLKDLVIVGGRNFYPHDIERAAESAHPSVRSGHCVAFSVQSPTGEELVVLAEVERGCAPDIHHEVMERIRRGVVDAVGVRPHTVVLARARALPRTSSGKARRDACRRLWEEGRLTYIANSNSLDAPAATQTGSQSKELTTRAVVSKWLAAELHIAEATIDFTQTLVASGVESLAVLRLQTQLEQHLGAPIDARAIWEAGSLDAMLRQLETRAVVDDGAVDHASMSAADQLAASEIDRGVNVIPDASSAASSTVVSAWPEYRALQARREALANERLELPFFQINDGVAGAFTQIDGVTLSNFASYNYLGLSGHPQVNEASQLAITRWGSSVSASRVVSGERPIHGQLELALAAFLGVDAALTFVGGHATNVSTIAHLVGADDLVCCDEQLHNSGMQGAQFSGAHRVVFAHNDWRGLDAILTRCRAKYRRALVLIESVDSADGDSPDLAAFVAVKQRHHAMLMVDEAHGLGVLGATGRGLAEASRVNAADVDVWMGTLSKALASCGGYIAGSAALIELLRFTGPGFVFSVGLAPSAAAAAHAALEVLQREPERVAQLRSRAVRFRERARAAQLVIGPENDTPIVPVMVSGSREAVSLSRAMQQRGVYVQPMIAPSVSEHAARLRFFLSCEHADAQIDHAVDTIAALLASASQRP